MNSKIKDYSVYILLILKEKGQSIKEIKSYYKNFNVKNIFNTLNDLIDNNLVSKKDKYYLTTEGEFLVKELDKLSYNYI